MSLDETTPADGDGVNSGVKVSELAGAIRQLKTDLNDGKLEIISKGNSKVIINDDGSVSVYRDGYERIKVDDAVKISDADGNTYIQVNSDDTISIYTSGSERVKVDDNSIIINGQPVSDTLNNRLYLKGAGAGYSIPCIFSYNPDNPSGKQYVMWRVTDNTLFDVKTVDSEEMNTQTTYFYINTNGKLYAPFTFQAGRTQNASGWVSVTFTKSFPTTPKVVATPEYAATNTYFFVEVRNITTTGFEFMTINHDGNDHTSTADYIQWLAICLV